jgi:tRNA 2-thiocytidine biosynthesis protein TtcA
MHRGKHLSKHELELVEKKLLHYTGKAIADFNLIEKGDRILVCLSGGKDSYTLLTLLQKLQKKAPTKFEIFALTLDQAQPGWDDSKLRLWLEEHHIAYEILTKDTYSIVKEKIPEGKTYCALCSRLRRGIIYGYAEKNNFNKIALGHHRDDLIRSLLMSILYNGIIASMPPKLLSNTKKNIVIRPLVYCQEADIIEYAKLKAFPIIPCNLCGSQENLVRKRVARLINDLAQENPKIPSNILHALTEIKSSQLMDKKLWDFKNLGNPKYLNDHLEIEETEPAGDIF